MTEVLVDSTSEWVGGGGTGGSGLVPRSIELDRDMTLRKELDVVSERRSQPQVHTVRQPNDASRRRQLQLITAIFAHVPRHAIVLTAFTAELGNP